MRTVTPLPAASLRGCSEAFVEGDNTQLDILNRRPNRWEAVSHPWDACDFSPHENVILLDS
jgi:hypothetical protein